MAAKQEDPEYNEDAFGQALGFGNLEFGNPLYNEGIYNEDTELQDEPIQQPRPKSSMNQETDIHHIDKDLLNEYQRAAMTNFRSIRNEKIEALTKSHKTIYTPPLISPRMSMMTKDILSGIPEFADDVSSKITYSIFDGSGALVKLFYVFVLLCVVSLLAGVFLYILMIAGIIYAVMKLLGI